MNLEKTQMKLSITRRYFVGGSTALSLSVLARAREIAQNEPAPSPSPKINVLVWDERQPAQKQAYSNFLGNEIAAHLERDPALSVYSVALDDPEQGLSAALLDRCRVLIWWGHVRNGEVAPVKGRQIVDRILAGKLSLIALHSAHWSAPFVAAMNQRTISTFQPMIEAQGDRNPKSGAIYVNPPARFTVLKPGDRLTPYVSWRKFTNGSSEATVQLPYCCFPAYRPDGKPSEVTVKLPRHPIATGLPARFTIDQTEMYDEPFHVPDPDEVVLEERWAGGEWFRSGMVWNLGKGKVFYFRPGHETYPVFKNPDCLRIVTNAVHWLGG
jgi:trehalose utilization protein